jgi:hypothetical protein
MLPKILMLVGVDLQRHLAELKGRVDEFTRDTTNRVKGEIEDLTKDLAVTIGLFMVGAGLGLISFVVLLIGIYRWMEVPYGSDIALTTVGGVAAGMMAVMFLIAASRETSSKARRLSSGQRKSKAAEESSQDNALHSSTVQTRTPPASPYVASPSISSASGELHRPLATALEELLTASPTTGTAFDNVLKQVTHGAAAASGQTVNMAADIVRTGPRKAIYGVLGASVVLGWYLARKHNRV